MTAPAAPVSWQIVTGRRLARALPWALLALFVVRCLLAMRSDGTTADEPLHLWYGERALTAGTFQRANDTFNSKMPVSALNAIPAVAAARLRPNLSWRRRLFLARLPTVLLAVLLGCLVWRWATALFGWRSGALALFLYTFCPNVLAHAHLVTTDLATALGMFAATFCLWRYLQAPSPGRLALAAAVFGAAQLTKATALLLLPIFAAILAGRALRLALRAWAAAAAVSPDRPAVAVNPERPARAFWRELARGARLLLALCAGAIVVVNLGFLGQGTLTPLQRYAMVSDSFRSLAAVPVLRDLPLPLPYAYVQGLDMVARDSTTATWSYLHGRYSQTGFRSYFLVAALVKVPLAAQLLLVLALWLWLAGLRAPDADGFLLLPALVLLVYLSLCFTLDIGLRYLLPAFPFLFVLSGRAAAPLGPRTGPAVRWRPATVLLLVAWEAVASWSVHPHYLAYFNELAGGPAHGSRWLIDSNLDWGQDAERVRDSYPRAGAAPLFIAPSGPLAGRIAAGLSELVGRDPAAAARHAWLRDNFKPVATIGYSWQVFEVTEAEIARCCAGLTRAWTLVDLAGDLALSGQPFAGADGAAVRLVDHLDDGVLGANDVVDPARTTPPLPHPVRAWFGIAWPSPQTIGRVQAFPSFFSRGPEARRFLALDYVFQAWDGAGWRDLPGTRVANNQALRLEHRFPPVRTTRLRLLVERERNERGEAAADGAFRAACLELAVYQR
jgi:4-amino-4-deoxy-L-arabinose transferase-like glycosyltransferase